MLIRLCIRILKQKTGGQERSHEGLSGGALRVGHGEPSIARFMMFGYPTGN